MKDAGMQKHVRLPGMHKRFFWATVRSCQCLQVFVLLGFYAKHRRVHDHGRGQGDSPGEGETADGHKAVKPSGVM